MRDWSTVYEVVEAPAADEFTTSILSRWRRPASAGAPGLGTHTTSSKSTSLLRSATRAVACQSPLTNDRRSSSHRFGVSISAADWRPGPLGSSPELSPESMARSAADGRQRAAEFITLLAGPPPPTRHFQRPRSLHASSVALQRGASKFQLANEPSAGFGRRDDFGTWQSGRAIASRWDRRHSKRVETAERIHRVMQQSATRGSLRTPDAFHDALWEIRRERPQLVRPLREAQGRETTAGQKAAKVGPKHTVIGLEWSLERSIFGPRKAWADSGAFQDDSEHIARCVLCDWEVALEDHNTRGEGDAQPAARTANPPRGGHAPPARLASPPRGHAPPARLASPHRQHALMYSMCPPPRPALAPPPPLTPLCGSTGFIQEVDTSGGDAVAACAEVLRASAAAVLGIYDYYAILSAPAQAGAVDVTTMQSYGFKRWVDDCQLVVAGSATVKMSAFDQLFKLVNALSDDLRAIDRQEWLQVLVRTAVLRYVQPGGVEARQTTSVAAALRTLLEVDLLPRVDPRALHDLFAARGSMYNQDVDNALRQTEGSLRAIFYVYARGDGGVSSEVCARYVCARATADATVLAGAALPPAAARVTAA